MNIIAGRSHVHTSLTSSSSVRACSIKIRNASSRNPNNIFPIELTQHNRLQLRMNFSIWQCMNKQFNESVNSTAFFLWQSHTIKIIWWIKQRNCYSYNDPKKQNESKSAHEIDSSVFITKTDYTFIAKYNGEKNSNRMSTQRARNNIFESHTCP